jgi:hypothetical protein
MTDQNQDQNPPAAEDQPQETDYRAARRQRIAERRAARGGRDAWIGGIILVGIGLLLLLRNTTGFELNNWWALFILIPALGAFANAWRAYQESGRLNAQARSSIFGGLILTMITAIFLFNLNWTYLGPILLILAGIGIFINVALPG